MLIGALGQSAWNDATGGTITEVANYNGTGQTWRIHTFTSGTSTLTLRRSLRPINVLVVGGGGGAGRSSTGSTSARGGHGYNLQANNQMLSAGAYTITVGAGGIATVSGTAPGGNGGTSSMTTVGSANGGTGSASDSNTVGAGGSTFTSTIEGSSKSYASYPNRGGGGNGPPTGMGPYSGADGIGGVVIVAYQIG